MISDEEIIERYFSRDESAITATAQKYGGRCYGVAYNILRAREDAEECVSAARLKVLSFKNRQKPFTRPTEILKAKEALPRA